MIIKEKTRKKFTHAKHIVLLASLPSWINNYTAKRILIAINLFANRIENMEQ